MFESFCFPFFVMRNYHTKKNVVVGGYGKTKRTHRLKRIFVYLWWFVLVIIVWTGIFAWVWFDNNIMDELPEVDQYTIEEQILLSQSTTITDREGNELYTLFEENRTKVQYDDISPLIIDALVAVEDQRFWENDGLDYVGIARAAIITAKNKALWRGNLQWASTLTQQLVRNFFFEKWDDFYAKLKRKLKEIVITKQLDSLVEEYILARQDLSGEVLEKAKKEQILEWYLNLIFLGNNAYGVEAATQTYFNKPASDVTLLEAAIIASIPKGPSLYEPYKRKNRQRLMWWVVAEQWGETIYLSGDQLASIHQDIANSLLDLDLDDKSDNELFVRILNGESKKTQQIGDGVYTYYYQWGRKDSSLLRMYDEGYITQDQLKEAIIQGLWYEFASPRIDIDAPHFVFWVQDFLLQNEIFSDLALTEEALKQWGFTIQTTLHPQIQDIAEQTIAMERAQLIQKGWSNRSMIHVDSSNGDVLAYVGSVDYNDAAIEGQNDMVTSPRQPGSTMKPLIYAYGFMTIPLALDTPLYDIPFRIGSLEPWNADGGYMGMMSLKNALAYSRNIPAVKMYFAAGKEEKLLPFLRDIWLNALDGRDYGYSLALGAGEVPMLEMAQAYSHLSRLGEGALINPILSITWPNGEILYQKDVIIPERVIPAGVAYLIREILSNPAHMPPGWVRYFTNRNVPFAVKSGTSDMKVPGEGSFPRDGWLNTYTPDRVTLMRAWNADASPLNRSAYGWFLNASLVQFFYNELASNNLIEANKHRAVDVSTVSINKVNGLLMSDSTPSEFAIQTLAYNKTLPASVDTGMEPFSFDPLCRWALGDYTPKDEEKSWYLYANPVSFIPSQMDAADIKQRFAQWNTTWEETTRKVRVDYNLPHIFVNKPEQSCPNRLPIQNTDIVVTFDVEGNTTIWYDLPLTFGAFSADWLSKIEVKIGDTVLFTEEVEGNTYSNQRSLQIPPSLQWLQTLMVTAYDSNNHFNSRLVRVSLLWDDLSGPLLGDVSIQETDGWYDVTMTFVDASWVLWWEVIVQWEEYEFAWDTVSFFVENLSTVTYVVGDREQNIIEVEYDLRQE